MVEVGMVLNDRVVFAKLMVLETIFGMEVRIFRG